MFLRFLSLFLLTAACSLYGATRKEDMQQSRQWIRQQLERYGSYQTWSDTLRSAREKFNRNRQTEDQVSSHGQFGNFVEAMQSVQKACDELGIDLVIIRQPTAAEKAFASLHDRQMPDPFIYQMQELLADEKIELIEAMQPGQPPPARRLQDRYPAGEYARKILIFGDRKDFPGVDADFAACSGNGEYFASDLVRAGKGSLLNRPAVIFSAPGDLLFGESALLPHPDLLSIPETAYRSMDAWDAANWHKLGFEPVPEAEDPFFRILPDRSLQLAPLLPGADSGMAGTLRLPLPDPPGSSIRIVLTLEGPARLEVRATCGRDKATAGVLTDREGSRVELRLRPTWLSRIVTLQFYLHGKARLREIRLYRAN